MNGLDRLNEIYARADEERPEKWIDRQSHAIRTALTAAGVVVVLLATYFAAIALLMVGVIYLLLYIASSALMSGPALRERARKNERNRNS